MISNYHNQYIKIIIKIYFLIFQNLKNHHSKLVIHAVLLIIIQMDSHQKIKMNFHNNLLILFKKLKIKILKKYV
jgi:hypothetical protein